MVHEFCDWRQLDTPPKSVAKNGEIFDKFVYSLKLRTNVFIFRDIVRHVRFKSYYMLLMLNNISFSGQPSIFNLCRP